MSVSLLIAWLIVIVIRILYEIVKHANVTYSNKEAIIPKQNKMKFNRKIKNVSTLFSGHYVDVKTLYAVIFKRVPCVCFIGEIDTSKAFEYIKEMLATDVREFYQHAYFDHADQKVYFNNTVFVMRNRRMIEVGIDYCHILFGAEDFAWANSLMKELSSFKIARNFPQNKIVGFARQFDAVN